MFLIHSIVAKCGKRNLLLFYLKGPFQLLFIIFCVSHFQNQVGCREGLMGNLDSNKFVCLTPVDTASMQHILEHYVLVLLCNLHSMLRKKKTRIWFNKGRVKGKIVIFLFEPIQFDGLLFCELIKEGCEMWTSSRSNNPFLSICST